LKKPAGSVQFWFYKQKPEKTEPNRAQPKKPSQNRKKPSQNRKKPRKPSQTEKTESKQKMITHFQLPTKITYACTQKKKKHFKKPSS